MKHKKALIIGIFGQDGYLMSKLLKKNYKIIGIFRKFHIIKTKNISMFFVNGHKILQQSKEYN